ncbi:MAG: DUF3124 domain-containing protein [Cyclobacteriaceae bacterium]|nr:DUF3124 domain-containing protein [Cyclobacteriaceae bacterium]
MRCIVSILLILVLASCNQQKETTPVHTVNWEKRRIAPNTLDNLFTGSTYLSVYSEVYQVTENRTYHLTVTVSMRNISSKDSVYISSAKYYNTEGHLIRTYLDNPIFIAPLETVEIVINEGDKEGGTGGNFIFEWGSPVAQNEPHFEAIMISTTGQQGLSFTTQGIKR